MEDACLILRSYRKTISIEITQDADLLVRAPHRIPKTIINEFISKKSAWIEKKKQLVRERQKNAISKDMVDVVALKKRARYIIEERLNYYVGKHGFRFNGFKITSARSRFGSCTAKGDLNFSWRLILFSPEVMDYVVIHELTHLIEFNHSKRFWAKVEEFMPEFRLHKKWLRENSYIIR
ncbi:M48 family metallopeptidase [Candidatus Saganbacteria bacterium]|nr:M48 family metallopeptidase [Candidatus Saganbacteria bacterium]